MLTNPGLVDYHEFVSESMDLGTVKKRLAEGVYDISWDAARGLSLVSEDFLRDVNLMFTNAYAYNKPMTPVARKASELEQIFSELVSQADASYRPSPSQSTTAARLKTCAAHFLRRRWRR